MGDRPIIFSAPMIRALLAGRKTQTRRLYKPMNRWVMQEGREVRQHEGQWCHFLIGAELPMERLRLPYAAGDRLWMKENHRFRGASYNDGTEDAPDWSEDEWFRVYGAGGPSDSWDPQFPDGWSPSAHAGVHELTDPGESEGPSVRGYATKLLPSIHMPRWASRLMLIVTDVRGERLQDISEADAGAEGAPRLVIDEDGKFYADDQGGTYRCGFAGVWAHIHGADAWEANPWFAAISFRVHRANIDALGADALHIAGAA